MSDGGILTAKDLARIALFRGICRDGLEAAAGIGRMRLWGKNRRIFEQGQAGVRAHVLLSGSLRVSQSGSDGGLVIVRFVSAGELFGAVSLFTNDRYPAEAVCVTDCAEVSWSEAEVTSLIAGYPGIATNLLHIVGHRLQETQERVRELSTQRAEQRLANAVIRLARQAGRTAVDGTAIEFPLRRKDVADISGTTLHTASRILTAWEKAGWLSSRGQTLTVCHMQNLIRIGEDVRQ